MPLIEVLGFIGLVLETKWSYACSLYLDDAR